MKRVLWIPADPEKPAEVINLDDSGPNNTPFDLNDPYKLFQQLWNVKLQSSVWGEKVRVMGLEDFGMMVDDEGRLKGDGFNRRASFIFYPGSIHGDVMVFKYKLEYSPEGPEEVIYDYDWQGQLLDGENGLTELWLRHES